MGLAHARRAKQKFINVQLNTELKSFGDFGFSGKKIKSHKKFQAFREQSTEGECHVINEGLKKTKVLR